MPRTGDKLWRAPDKAVVLSPPKHVTWHWTVGTVAGGKTTHFYGFFEKQKRTVGRIIAFSAYALYGKRKGLMYMDKVTYVQVENAKTLSFHFTV